MLEESVHFKFELFDLHGNHEITHQHMLVQTCRPGCLLVGFFFVKQKRIEMDAKLKENLFVLYKT